MTHPRSKHRWYPPEDKIQRGANDAVLFHHDLISSEGLQALMHSRLQYHDVEPLGCEYCGTPAIPRTDHSSGRFFGFHTYYKITFTDCVISHRDSRSFLSSSAHTSLCSRHCHNSGTRADPPTTPFWVKSLTESLVSVGTGYEELVREQCEPQRNDVTRWSMSRSMPSDGIGTLWQRSLTERRPAYLCSSMITTRDPSTMTTEVRDAEVITLLTMGVTRAHRAIIAPSSGRREPRNSSTSGRE